MENVEKALQFLKVQKVRILSSHIMLSPNLGMLKTYFDKLFPFRST